ncbi:adenylate cyclase A [Epichloe bromicola]|uniref:Adenylate cyclase A, partial n=1 Tax=Epichloe bromicola TaxID=79588 RepID=A0ABQ0CNJ5_9HYPO
MEAAAKTVEVLSKRILPEKPHQLSFSSTWRHRPLPEDDDDVAESRGAKRRLEEWHNTRLQYLTFLSEADRGTLLTRSYYDMRQEPSKPVPREVTALSKGAATAEKKKLSLSDYKNKKTGIVASASPPEPAIAKRNEAERPAPPPTSSATSTPTIPHADGAKPHQESRRSDGLTRIRDLDSSSASAKPKPNRDAIAPESRLPPKPPSLPPRPPSPAGKRRMPDADDDRPQKRSRPDDRRLAEDRFQRDRDDVPRRKDKIPPPSRDRDHRHVAGQSSSKDERGIPPSPSLPNGRSLLKGATNPDRNTSFTGGRSRGDSVNGVRPSAAAHNSSRGTPTKADGASAAAKSFVPPLLSPLHLSFDSREGEKRLRAEEEDAKAKKERERKRRDDADEGGASSRSKRLDPTVPVTKKPRPPAVIPPLLSPTLPPAVEAELRRRKKSTSDSSDERPRDGRDVLGMMKKRPAANGDVDDRVKLVPAPASKLGHRRRLVVMLDVPKSLRPSFARIVGHAPARRKDSQSQSERELDRRPRAGSDDAAQQPPARKRPMGSAEGLSAAGATAMKRPRSSDMPGHPKLGTPSTPSKKTTTTTTTTAMSRVSSTNSVAQTPTELTLVNSTPSASATVDRRPNGSEMVVAGKGEKPEARMVREKEERLMIVGKNLKHDADLIMKKHRGDSALSMRDRPGESKVKLGYVLSLESIIAFMMGFHAQNVYRGMYNKIGDTTGWTSMFPLMDFLEIEMRRADVTNYQPLYAMLLLLYGVSIDEIVKCYVHHDNLASPTVIENLAKQERRKCRMWLQVREANAAVRNPRLRVDVHPWSTLDDIVEASLRALRLWCVEENIDWTQEQTLRENWPVKPPHSRR